jgi:hypothetical protein
MGQKSFRESILKKFKIGSVLLLLDTSILCEVPRYGIFLTKKTQERRLFPCCISGFNLKDQSIQIKGKMKN